MSEEKANIKVFNEDPAYFTWEIPKKPKLSEIVRKIEIEMDGFDNMAICGRLLHVDKNGTPFRVKLTPRLHVESGIAQWFVDFVPMYTPKDPIAVSEPRDTSLARIDVPERGEHTRYFYTPYQSWAKELVNAITKQVKATNHLESLLKMEVNDEWRTEV